MSAHRYIIMMLLALLRALELARARSGRETIRSMSPQCVRFPVLTFAAKKLSARMRLAQKGCSFRRAVVIELSCWHAGAVPVSTALLRNLGAGELMGGRWPAVRLRSRKLFGPFLSYLFYRKENDEFSMNQKMMQRFQWVDYGLKLGVQFVAIFSFSL